MLFNTGTYKGNGAQKTIKITFKPKFILIKGDTTQWMVMHTDVTWLGRTVALGASDSFQDGIRFIGEGVMVGNDPSVNSSGVNYHWIAIGDDGLSDFDLVTWAGNQLENRQITLQTPKTPIACMIKRDSTRDGVFKVGTNAAVFMGGTAATDAVTLTGPGVVTLTAALQVNEWNSAGGLGESIVGLFLYGGINSATISWVGDGVSGRTIPLGLRNASAAFISHPTVGQSCRLITDTMAGLSGHVSNLTGLAGNEASISGNNLVIGSSTVLNTAGVTYTAVVFSKKLTPKISAPYIKVKNTQAVYLPAGGIASYINCGTSNATLNISGNISYEWFGAAWFDPTAASVVDNYIIYRGDGPYGNPGGYSWGLALGNTLDGHDWSGPFFAPQAHNMISLAAPLDTANWRTGFLVPWGQFCHLISTQDSSGNAKLYVNGKLHAQRANAAAAISSVSGHPTIIGARSSAGAITKNTKLMIREIAIYSIALTADQVLARYERAALGSTSATDVVTGRAAWWNADNAGVGLLPDEVNSANNGAIFNGSILML